MCEYGKKKLNFQYSSNYAKTPFEIVHTDMWGQAPIQFNYVHFIHEINIYTWIFLLCSDVAKFSQIQTPS